MATKVFNRGNFMIVQKGTSEETPIPLTAFDYETVVGDTNTTFKFYDRSQDNFRPITDIDSNIQDETGTPIGTVAAIKTYLGDETTINAAGTITSTPSGTQDVDVVANTVGLSTSAKQDTGNTSLASIDIKLTDNATETTLTSIKTEISSVKTNTNTLPLGTSSPTVTVAASATTVTLIAANTSRKSVKIWNNSTAILYVKESAGAALTSFTYKLQQDEAVVIDDYNGIVTGVWASATGDAQVTETT